MRITLCTFVLVAAAAFGFAAEDKSPDSKALKNHKDAHLLLRRYLAAQQSYAARSKKYATDLKKLVGKASKTSPLPWYKIEAAHVGVLGGKKNLHGYRFAALKTDDKSHAVVAVPGKYGSTGTLTLVACASRRDKIAGGTIWARDTGGKAPAKLPPDLKKDGWMPFVAANKPKAVKLDAAQEKKIRKFIDQLGNDDFAVRERASAELKKLVKIASPFLKKAAAESKDPELVSRARAVLRSAVLTSGSEAHAVGYSRTYCSAQTMFKRNDWDRNEILEYAPRFGMLHSTPDGNGDAIQLLMKSMRDAVTPEKPLKGYFFADMATIGGKAIDWVNDYALCAIPAKYGGSTRRTFIVCTNGTVFAKDTGGKPVFDYPADPTVKGWVIAE